MLIEVEVQKLGLDPATNTPVVILQESGGDRVIYIWIGPAEASAIAMQLADMQFPRPLTHDLLVSALKGLGGQVQKVLITRVEQSTFFAELIVQRDGQVFSLDARPSDSIAVALRSDARIYAEESLLEPAGMETDEAETAPATGSHGSTPSPVREMDVSEVMGPEELKEHLRKLNPEDFGRFTP